MASWLIHTARPFFDSILVLLLSSVPQATGKQAQV
jgi:hypothetical protein